MNIKAILMLALVMVSFVSHSQNDVEKSTDDEKKKGESAAEADTQDPNASSSIQFRLYSDFVGLQDDQPNGLIQTEFFFNWRLNPNKNKRRLIFFHNLVAPDIAFLKIDEKERSLPVLFVTSQGNETYKALNAIDLVKYANLRVGVKLNLLKYSFGRSRVYIDGYALHYRTQLNDSTLKDPKYNFNSFGAGMNVLFQTYGWDYKFRLDLVYSLFGIKNYSNSYAIVSSPLMSPARSLM